MGINVITGRNAATYQMPNSRIPIPNTGGDNPEDPDPTDPVDPDVPSIPIPRTPGAEVKTGDESNAALWIIAISAAALCLLGVGIKLRKSRK